MGFRSLINKSQSITAIKPDLFTFFPFRIKGGHIIGNNQLYPVYRINYFTDTDKIELVKAVMTALPNGDEVAY